MAFVQLTYRESLRDIEACLRAGCETLSSRLRRMVASSTLHPSDEDLSLGTPVLADANEAHDWRIFADFAQILIGIARPL
jgi:hypothetical protein